MFSFNWGELHPAIIHFPIAIIFGAFVFDILYWFKRIELFEVIAGWMIIIGAILIVPTAITGFLAKDFYPVGDLDIIRHQYMAIGTALFTFVYAIFRAYALKYNLIYIYVFLLMGFINVSLIGTTAEFGGIVVRGKGIMFNSLRPYGSPLPYSQVKENS